MNGRIRIETNIKLTNSERLKRNYNLKFLNVSLNPNKVRKTENAIADFVCFFHFYVLKETSQ